MNFLIHGINVTNSKDSVGKLTPYLENTYLFNYGWRLFSVLWHNRKDAKRLKKLLGKNLNSNVWAHSNGCAISVEAARRGAVIKNLICINPALKRNTVFPNSIERVVIIHTKNDIPTKMASICDKIPFLQILVPNAWGAMGREGSKTVDPRVVNMDFTEVLEGHSDFFEYSNLKIIMPCIQMNLIQS